MAVKHELPLHEDHICQHPNPLSISRSIQDESDFDMKRSQNDIGDEEWKKRAAWKFLGYPELSRHLASSDEHLIFRRFGELNVRVLLKLQDEVVQLERKLRRMDDFTMETPGAGCGSLRIDASTPRGELLEQIEVKLREYNTYLKSFLELQEQPAASTEQVRDLQNWLTDRPNIVEETEQEFPKYQGDLIAAKHQSSRTTRWWSRQSTDRVCSDEGDERRKRQYPCDRCDRVFSYPKDLRRHQPCSIYSCSKTTGSLEKPSPVISTAEALMLISPAWAMAFTCGETERLVLLGLFTIWFFALLLLNRRMSVQHRLVAVAGYFSIVVIMQCLTPTCPPTVSSQQTAFASPAVSYCAKQTMMARSDLVNELLAREAKLLRRVGTFS